MNKQLPKVSAVYSKFSFYNFEKENKGEGGGDTTPPPPPLYVGLIELYLCRFFFHNKLHKSLKIVVVSFRGFSNCNYCSDYFLFRPSVWNITKTFWYMLTDLSSINKHPFPTLYMSKGDKKKEVPLKDFFIVTSVLKIRIWSIRCIVICESKIFFNLFKFAISSQKNGTTEKVGKLYVYSA